MATKRKATVEAPAPAPAKRGPGRPRKDENMKMFPVHFYMPNAEAMEKLYRAAEAEQLTFSAWARRVLMKEAARTLGE